LVAQLYRESPAVAAGIKGADRRAVIGNRRILVGGDIITAINGRPVNDWISYLEFLETETRIGDTITLTLLRDGREIALEASVVAQP
jgi:S1-C subfamily serine protease